MVGYPESLTDPSYNRQILVFTYPLLGNYGIPGNSKDKYNLLENFESYKIWTSGLVIGDLTENYSHWSAVQSLSQWCDSNKIPGIYGMKILIYFSVPLVLLVLLLANLMITLVKRKFNKCYILFI